MTNVPNIVRKMINIIDNAPERNKILSEENSLISTMES